MTQIIVSGPGLSDAVLKKMEAVGAVRGFMVNQEDCDPDANGSLHYNRILEAVNKQIFQALPGSFFCLDHEHKMSNGEVKQYALVMSRLKKDFPLYKFGAYGTGSSANDHDAAFQLAHAFHAGRMTQVADASHYVVPVLYKPGPHNDPLPHKAMVDFAVGMWEHPSTHTLIPGMARMLDKPIHAIVHPTLYIRWNHTLIEREEGKRYLQYIAPNVQAFHYWADADYAEHAPFLLAHYPTVDDAICEGIDRLCEALGDT